MLNWSGAPQPSANAIRSAIGLRSPFLRMRGMHSVVFLPDEGECAAVMVATCRDADAVDELARSIDPSADVRVESMVFDDDPGTPAWLQHASEPPLPRGAARSLLQAIDTEG
jgi:hypothetical protein